MAEIGTTVEPEAAADRILADQEAAHARMTPAMQRHLEQLAPELHDRLRVAGVCDESAGSTT